MRLMNLPRASSCAGKASPRKFGNKAVLLAMGGGREKKLVPRAVGSIEVTEGSCHCRRSADRARPERSAATTEAEEGERHLGSQGW